MAVRRPLVEISGSIQELPTGDTLPGAGGLTVQEVEIDFGTTPVTEGVFTITDAGVTGSSRILLSPSGSTATGRTGNDYSWETFSFSAVAGTGSFDLYANCSNGSVVGKRKVIYTY